MRVSRECDVWIDEHDSMYNYHTDIFGSVSKSSYIFFKKFFFILGDKSLASIENSTNRKTWYMKLVFFFRCRNAYDMVTMMFCFVLNWPSMCRYTTCSTSVYIEHEQQVLFHLADNILCNRLITMCIFFFAVASCSFFVSLQML